VCLNCIPCFHVTRLDTASRPWYLSVTVKTAYRPPESRKLAAVILLALALASAGMSATLASWNRTNVRGCSLVGGSLIP
jgi:hypothetical protein